MSAALRQHYERVGPVAYRRDCVHACWRAGTLRYGLHEGQERAVGLIPASRERGIRRVVWNIARRWGKTKAALAVSSEACLDRRHHGGRVPYAGMTAESVAEFIEPQMIELAEEAPPELKPEVFKGAWVFPSTENRIVMRGCEDRKKANRLRGPAAIFAVIDEAAFIDCLEYVVRSVMAPQLVTTGGMMLVCSSAPETPEHPFRLLASEAEAEGAYMHATMLEAPHLSPAEIAHLCKTMGGAKSAQWIREALSQFIVDESTAIVPEFAHVEEHIVGEIERPAHFDLYVIGDLGYTDLTVILIGYYHFERALIVIEDEVVCRRPTSDVVHDEVQRKLALRFPGKEPLERAVDAPAITVADMRKLQPLGEDQDEDDPVRWHTVANDELHAAVNALRVVVGRKGILIHPRCTTLRAHMRNGIWNEQRTSFKRIKRDDGVHHFDAVAALVYMNRKVRLGRNPNPPPEMPAYGQGVVGGMKALERERESKWRRAFGRHAERR